MMIHLDQKCLQKEKFFLVTNSILQSCYCNSCIWMVMSHHVKGISLRNLFLLLDSMASCNDVLCWKVQKVQQWTGNHITNIAPAHKFIWRGEPYSLCKCEAIFYVHFIIFFSFWHISTSFCTVYWNNYILFITAENIEICS